MEIAITEFVAITDSSSVGEARRRGLLLAEQLGFDEVRCGEFALLITEVSRNVLVHGRRRASDLMGVKECARLRSRGSLAMDKGPGIANVAAAR